MTTCENDEHNGRLFTANLLGRSSHFFDNITGFHRDFHCAFPATTVYPQLPLLAGGPSLNSTTVPGAPRLEVPCERSQSNRTVILSKGHPRTVILSEVARIGGQRSRRTCGFAIASSCLSF